MLPQRTSFQINLLWLLVCTTIQIDALLLQQGPCWCFRRSVGSSVQFPSPTASFSQELLIHQRSSSLCKIFVTNKSHENNLSILAEEDNWVGKSWNKLTVQGANLIHQNYLGILWEVFSATFARWILPAMAVSMVTCAWFPGSTKHIAQVVWSLAYQQASGLQRLLQDTIYFAIQRWKIFRGARPWFRKAILMPVFESLLFQLPLEGFGCCLSILLRSFGTNSAIPKTNERGTTPSKPDSGRPPPWIVVASIIYGLSHMRLDGSIPGLDICRWMDGRVLEWNVGPWSIPAVDPSILIALVSFGFTGRLFFDVFGPIWVRHGFISVVGAQIAWEVFGSVAWKYTLLLRLLVRLVSRVIRKRSNLIKK